MSGRFRLGKTAGPSSNILSTIEGSNESVNQPGMHYEKLRCVESNKEKNIS